MNWVLFNYHHHLYQRSRLHLIDQDPPLFCDNTGQMVLDLM